jgi:hypothetical protein
MKRRVLVSITLPLTVLLVWVCWIAVSSYVRGPRLVAAHRTNKLPFWSSALPGCVRSRSQYRALCRLWAVDLAWLRLVKQNNIVGYWIFAHFQQ